jgi:hypothetical protein
MLFNFPTYPAAGPCFIARFVDDISFGDGGNGGDGGGGDTGTTTDTSTIATPNVIAQELSGGFSPQQLDQLAEQFETEEGQTLAIAFGEHMIAGTMIAHKYVAGTPQNNYVVALGEGYGGLGSRGEWEGPVKVWHQGQELTRRSDYTIWFADALPPNAVANPDTDGWNWVSTNPTPYVGKYSHQSPLKTGTHQHFFTGATGLAIGTGDFISAWIFIDATNPPTEVMLQFFIGADTEHRAYWGANSIPFGTDGTNSRRQISASVPGTGAWVRLDVAASVVGLESTTIDGMAFTLFGGLATWNKVMRWNQTAIASAGYTFRPGLAAVDFSDLPELIGYGDYPTGAAYNGTPIIAVRLNTTQSAEDRPDKFRARVKCRRNFIYDATGQAIGYGFATNPAQIAADRVLAFFQRIYRDNLALAEQKFRERIDWPSWVGWRDFCFASIPWNKTGSGNISIQRFEANIAFTADLSLADALDQITGLSATFWQDEGEKLLFRPPDNQAPVHHFDESNIKQPPTITPQDLRQIPNFFIAKYREIDDEFLGEVTTDVKRQDSINRVGEIKTTRTFATMRQSQAQRLLERQARIEHDNPIFCTLVGNATSIKVLPGEFVSVSHPVPDWDHQLCLVVDITVRSMEDSPDEIEFILQKIDGPLYDDTAHTPVQEALTLP